MAAVRALTGGGGWPMTVWLTPDRKPFYGGTYFPARDGDRGSRIGFRTLLAKLHEAYGNDPDRIADQAGRLTAHLRRLLTAPPAKVSVSLPGAVERAVESIASSFDETHGGFGGAPRFPRSVILELLLRYAHRTGEEKARAMAVRTLETMAAGGLYDQIGGGFHRYSTDARWLVPHFEKMLYDNALLTIAYLEAYQVTGRRDFERVAREVLRYVSREMSDVGGGFHSATDADSEGEEGKFFVWTPEQIASVLGADRAAWFNACYGVTETGNFENATSILHVATPLAEVAGLFGLAPERLQEELDRAREELYDARRVRVPPLKDEKVLVSWNGLMISAHARAAQILGDPSYAVRGAAAADFLLTRMRDGPELRRTWYEGRADGTGFLDDYAFLTQGLLDLYEATFEPRWLREAIALTAVLNDRFRDTDAGGYFMTPQNGEKLLAREKPGYDGAEPSGNSVAILNLMRLEEFTTDDRYRVLADEALGAFGWVLERRPSSVPKMLTAVDFRLDTPKEIIIVKPDRETSAEPLLAKLREVYLPNRIVVVASEGADLELQSELIPLLTGRRALGGKPTAYVCENRVCDLPTGDPEVFARQIRRRP